MTNFDLILPVFNFVDLTRIMLTCVRESYTQPSNIFLIDNGSTDDTFKLPEEFSDLPITYIRNDTNIGVNPAWNQGLQMLKSDIVGIINNDIEFPPYTFDLILEALNSWDKLGIVHPRRADRSEFEECKPKFPVLDTGHGIQGFCMFMKTSLWKEIGPVPKELIIFYGDDFIRTRTVELGYHLATIVNAPMFHHEGATVYGSHESRQWADMTVWGYWCAHRTTNKEDILSKLKKLTFNDMPHLELFEPYKDFYFNGLSMAVGNKSKIVGVELGSDVGMSARLFMEYLTELEVDYELTFIDPNYTLEMECMIDNSTTFFIHKTAEESAENFTNYSLDFIHIDVDPHEYNQTKKLIELYLPKLKQSGVILFHDASPVKFGVNQALLEVGDNYSITFCDPAGRYPVAAPAMLVRV